MRFALVEAAKSIRSQSLHDADVYVGVVIAHELGRSSSRKPASAVEIMIEQLLAQIRRQVGLGVIQKRRNIVLQRTFAATLIVQKERLRRSCQHNVARLEIAIEKIIAIGAQAGISSGG